MNHPLVKKRCILQRRGMKEELLENLVVGSDSNLVCNMMEQKYNLEDKALFA